MINQLSEKTNGLERLGIFASKEALDVLGGNEKIVERCLKGTRATEYDMLVFDRHYMIVRNCLTISYQNTYNIWITGHLSV